MLASPVDGGPTLPTIAWQLQPAWKWHHYENSNDDDSILFSIDDWPAMKKLGFHMKEEVRGL